MTAHATPAGAGAVLGVSVALLGRWVTQVYAAGLRAQR